jgi:hypothetical protein
MQQIDRLYSQVSDIHNAYGLRTPEQRGAVEQAYAVFREHSGPFMTSVAAEMLDDLKQDVRQDPDRVVAFLGRDGHSLAVAVRGLDPEFFDRHCREVVLSRAVVDGALQDLEKNLGVTFPAVEGFRGARNKVDPDRVDGTFRNLTEYLRESGVPLGREGSAVTVVDTSFKGTVQELLSAAYPETDLYGRYAFLGVSPSDPHPEAKQGYVFHQEPDGVWQGLPLQYLPDDRSQTFGNQDALGVIEETLHGPLGSPRSIGAGGPEQEPQRHEPDPLVGLNPVLVARQYRDPAVREAVKTAAVLAVYDSAVAAGESRAAGRDWRAELTAAREKFTDQVRSWVAKDSGADAKLSTVLDSFVRRNDKNVIKTLDRALAKAGIGPEMADPLWRQFAKTASLEEKKQFLQRVTTPEAGGNLTPEAHLRTCAASAATTEASRTGLRSVASAASLHRTGGRTSTTGSQHVTDSGSPQRGEAPQTGSRNVPGPRKPSGPRNEGGGPSR